MMNRRVLGARGREQMRIDGTPMIPEPFHRLRKATVKTPIILLYAAVIVTVLTILYWLLGG
jgi:hypothetical protein